MNTEILTEIIYLGKRTSKTGRFEEPLNLCIIVG